MDRSGLFMGPSGHLLGYNGLFLGPSGLLMGTIELLLDF